MASYLARIRRYSKCSDACLVLTLVYVDRAIETKGLLLSALNIHRLIIVAVMLAAKFHEDLFYNNAFYAQLGEYLPSLVCCCVLRCVYCLLHLTG